jgi:6-phosphofructokinase 1
MGRHAGWIAAASCLAQEEPGDAPHLVLLPEVPFDQKDFLAEVKSAVEKRGYCVVVVSEGAAYANGKFVADAGGKDAFGHTQLGGVAPVIANMVKKKHGYKYHWAVADYLQRAGRHIASGTDVKQAYAVGEAAVKFALAGKNAVMPTIVRTSDSPYRWKIGEVALSKVANVEKPMPKRFISKDGYGITAAGRRYLAPLIQGEDYPTYKDGMPKYVRLKNVLVGKKLKAFKAS